jgi:putative GTP pyrophosphokinase
MPKRSDRRQDIDLLAAEYRQILPRAEAFAAEMKHQLAQMAAGANLSLAFPIQARVKSLESITEKLVRLPSLPISHVTDIQDLVGLRMVLLFQRDTVELCKLIEKSFAIRTQYNTQDRLKEDQFGYSSHHYVLGFPAAWLTVPTLEKLGGFSAELQVRTLAQHMWAETSHVLQYKQQASVPASILRSIFRVSALLETVDFEFERVLSEREEYREQIRTSSPDDRLNVDLLEQVLAEIYPAVNRDDEDDFGDLLVDLTRLGVSSVSELRELTSKWMEQAKKDEARKVAADQEAVAKAGPTAVEDPGRTHRGVFYTFTGLTRWMLEREFGTKYQEYFRQKYNLKRP